MQTVPFEFQSDLIGYTMTNRRNTNRNSLSSAGPVSRGLGMLL